LTPPPTVLHWPDAGGGGSGGAIASGGTETTAGGYKYHTFNSNGTLTVSSAGSVEYCIVAVVVAVDAETAARVAVLAAC